jgi:hypothetical protein
MQAGLPKARGSASILMMLSLVLANLANLGIQFVIPRLLVPEEYTRFAMMWASGQLVAALLFEWLRIGVVRYSVNDAGDPRRLPETLAALYAALLVGASVLAVILLATGRTGSAMFMAGLILFYACAQGAFDGQQANLRARFLNVRFSVTWMVRSVLSFSLTLVVASAFSDGRFALAALSASFLIVSLFAGLSPRSLRWPARSSVVFLMKFGLFAAAAGIISFALPLVARYAMVHYAGGTDSAGAVLAVDIAQKILMALGTAVNLLLLQPVISRVNRDPEEGSRYMESHLINVVALFSAAMVVLLYANSVMVTYFVPPAFLESYSKVSLLAVISIVLVCLKSYGLDALFAIGGKTVYSVVTSGVALLLVLLGCGGLYVTHSIGLSSTLVVLVLALVAGLVLATYFAASVLSLRLPWGKLSRILLVTAAAMVASFLLAVYGNAVVQIAGFIVIAFIILGGYRALGVGGPRQWLGQS